MPVTELALQDVDELDARVLEAGENLALVVQGHEERLENPARPALDRQQLVGVAALGATTHHFRALPRFDMLRTTLIGRITRKNAGQCRPERIGQARPRIQAGGGLAILNLAGVPSIVFGLFGLGLFCLFFPVIVSEANLRTDHALEIFGSGKYLAFQGWGTSLLAGGLTLAVMILPVIIGK